MEGFDDAVDGYFDVADGMARYVMARAEEHFADVRAEKRSIDTCEGFEARRDAVREAVRSSIGGLPDRMADPSVETTGRIDREGYTIELLVLESRPDVHVTANCYVPDGDGPIRGSSFSVATSTTRRPTRTTSGPASNWHETASSSSSSTRCTPRALPGT